MKKTKFMSLIAILLMFVVALTCGFLFACGSDDEDEVTDQGTVEENPTDPTDPTDPTEPTDPTDPTEPSESNEDVLVSIYDGTAEQFGGNGYYADFRNLHELTVDATTAEDGSAIYAIEGMATLMTKSQIYAFNAGENEDGAKTGDAFIIVEIAAPEGSTINYNGIEVKVSSDPTDGVFIQGIRENGTKEMPVTITYSGGTEVSFVISLEGVTIPSDYIIGTWSSGEITAEVTINLGSFPLSVNATTSVELTVNGDGTYTLTIINIHTSYDNIIDLSSYAIEMTGAWESTDDAYTLTGEEGNEVTVTLADGENGECCLTMSFTITYSFGDMDIPITVTEETLTAGALALESSAEGDDE